MGHPILQRLSHAEILWSFMSRWLILPPPYHGSAFHPNFFNPAERHTSQMGRSSCMQKGGPERLSSVQVLLWASGSPRSCIQPPAQFHGHLPQYIQGFRLARHPGFRHSHASVAAHILTQLARHDFASR